MGAGHNCTPRRKAKLQTGAYLHESEKARQRAAELDLIHSPDVHQMAPLPLPARAPAARACMHAYAYVGVHGYFCVNACVAAAPAGIPHTQAVRKPARANDA